MTECYIGIDHGSTNFKAGLFSTDGTLLADSSRQLENLRSSAGIVEQDPASWKQAMLEVFEEMIRKVPDAHVKAIGACTQVSSQIFIGNDLNPITNVIQWQDQRSAKYVDDAKRVIEENPGSFPEGFAVDATSTVIRAKWVHDELPKVWENTRYVLNPKDYLNLMLTGIVAGEPLSNYDSVGPDGKYVSGLDLIVPHMLKRLPELKEFRQVQGPYIPQGNPVVDEALKDAIVAVGTMDEFGNLYGSGAYKAGDAIEVCGTCEIVGVLTERVTPTPGVVSFSPVDGLYHIAGPTKSGGASTQWICKVLGINLKEFNELAESVPAGSEGLVFLPYLEGERAPIWDSDARGIFIGLSGFHTKAHFCRAVIEGVAFSARHLLEELDKAAGFKAEELRISGGGSNSDLCCQIRADVLNRRLNRLAVRNSGMIGAVTMAAVACGDVNDIGEAAAALVHVDTVFEPNPDNREKYDALYKIYRDTYVQSKPMYQQLIEYRKL